MPLEFISEEQQQPELSDVQAAAQAVLQDAGDPDIPIDHQYKHFGQSLATLYQEGKMQTLAPALPFLLTLRGEPYSLKDHFMMEPVFKLVMPRNLVLKCGRQVSKTQSVAAQNCVITALIPFFSSLYVAPRFEQTRRFSNDYIKPLLLDSPIGRLMVSSKVEQSVLQRTFLNRSTQYFSYAFLDCERIRGISAGKVIYDEAQDIDPDFVPVINEVMSHSQWNVTQFTGTPKTFDNNLQFQYDKSSQAEWVTRCEHCGHWNIACVEEDLLQMIRPRGISCAKCEGGIDPRQGHWEHMYRDRISLCSGYHVPQMILPIHYANREKWLDIVRAMEEMPRQGFYNEKLGEAFDVRSALLTRADLIRASDPKHDNVLKTALKLRDKYFDCTMGVDWGGGGEEGISYTTVAVIGHTPSGKSDVLYGERLTDAYDQVDEAAIILKLFMAFRCSTFSHDFGGAGGIREILMIQAGLPLQSVFPCMYVRATAASLVTYKSATGDGSRAYYSVDKARSLVLLCQLVGHGMLRFPRFETWESLATDFLALVEDKHEMPRGPDVYLITRKSGQSDDFAHSVNFAMIAHWERQGRYPDLAKRIGVQVSQIALKTIQSAAGASASDWEAPKPE